MTAQGAKTGSRERRGSFMSNKQIARSAIHGRKVKFGFLFTQPAHEVAGYVVGMDDYHWLLAVVVPTAERTDGDPVATVLVHKSAQIVTLGSTDALSTEDPEAQAAIRKIGGKFWENCAKNIMGIHPQNN